MNEPIIAVFTSERTEDLLRNGGTGTWVINQDRLDTLQYVVCLYNDDPKRAGVEGPASTPRNAAFFVGKIDSYSSVRDHNGNRRFNIIISEYAVLDEPIEGFRGKSQNPVVYLDFDACADRGLNIDRLDFISMPPRDADALVDPQPVHVTPGISPLTIAQAKAGLAANFGIDPEKITITIVG